MAATQKIEKVMPLLLRLEKNKNDYFPQAVSLGPYHHGEPDLAFVEAFKPKAVELLVSGGPEIYDESFYRSKIVDIICQIRGCYEESTIGKYSDDEVAAMMIHDASLMIIYMEMSVLDETDQQPDELMMNKILAMMDHLGMLTLAILSRDLLLLQNQIPLCVVELLMDLRYGEGKGEYENLLNRYMNMAIFGEYRQKRVTRKPLHLVEAIHMLLVLDCEKTTRRCPWLCCFNAEEDQSDAASTTCCSCKLLKKADLESGGAETKTTHSHGITHRLRKSLACKNQGAAAAKKDNIKSFIHSFRSVTELKAKGIHFKPSPTQSLMDVNFKSNFFYATLQLPEWGVSTKTKVTFMNLVAYELSPNSPANGEVASYITFMKSLMERPEDVKELRERRIFINMLGSDEEVFNIYKDINTHGADNLEIFRAVKDDIQAHYNSSVKTWMAELIHTNFRSPWTITAFLAAVALLAISAGQLYYAVNPN
ncbi:UPF0481 protein At3g47200-like [Salvia miltiorrhiza]|uniref:UPF0481 protein At3g47200-like n=1 Tax=Salvia miltiorrhiza TaxID=226208 RepID=UPI0025AD284C|nr:UPF0481 protein At3g47200-like [Salvia miltiorrhiza]